MSADPDLTDERSMREYYAARAPWYDEVYQQPERRNDLDFLHHHIPSRLIDRRVLEVACGTGFWTPHIAAVAEHVTATDGLPEPLAYARQRTGVAGVTFMVADAHALPASLGTFNGAFAGLWFSHVPLSRRATFFDILHARLEPGARVLLLDNSVVQLKDFPIHETDAEGNTWQLRALRDGSSRRVLKNFPTEVELQVCLGSRACRTSWRELDNFWLFEYELPPTSKADRQQAAFRPDLR